MPKCMITGCELKIGNSTIHGDLFEEGYVWIFNAVGHLEEKDLYFQAKVIEIMDDEHLNYFERRNVFVVAKLHTTLNDYAYNYLNKHEDETH